MNTAYTSLRQRVTRLNTSFNALFAPKIWSTLDVELNSLRDNIKTDVDSLHHALWRRSRTSECSVSMVDPKELFWRWIALNWLFDVDYMDSTWSSWDARDIMCAMDLPEGDTKVVVHRRPVPWESPNVLLFRDCYFLLLAVYESEADKDDSVFMWPLATEAYKAMLEITPGSGEERPDKQASPYLCTLVKKRQDAGKESASPPREELISLDPGSPEDGSCDSNPRQADPETRTREPKEYSKMYPQTAEYVQYFLLCEGLKRSEILNMLRTVAKDVGERGGYVALTCPWDAKEFMEDLLGQGLKPASQESPSQGESNMAQKPVKFFGHRLSTFVEEHKGNVFVRFVITKDMLRCLVGIIKLFRDLYGTAIDDLFDMAKYFTQPPTSVCSALRQLEHDVISRVIATDKVPFELFHRTYDEESEVFKEKRSKPLTDDGWSMETLEKTLNEAAKLAGIKSSLKLSDEEKELDQTKPPMVIFVGNIPYKVLWHTKGRTVIKEEYEIGFTGTGVKVARTSVFMWLTLAIGILLVLFYGIYRGLTSDVSFEDLLQAALSIAALYAATIIPLVYYLCYNDESLADVASGRVHLDKRSEFKSLSKEEKLYLCLRSLKKRASDRQFIDAENTCYLSGTEDGGAMHVSCMPCIGNLLMMGFEYWEEGERRGLLSPTREVFELKEVDRTPTFRHRKGPPLKQEKHCPYRDQLMHAEKEEKSERNSLPRTVDCPIEHYYVGFGAEHCARLHVCKTKQSNPEQRKVYKRYIKGVL